MRAFVIEGARDAEVREVKTPQAHAGQVLVRVAYVGICGSDLHYYFNGANGDFVVKEPLIPGHEVSGTVAHDPSGKLAEGTPVTIHPARFGTKDLRYGRHLWNGGSYLGSAATWPHTQGAMSDYLLVEDYMVRELPANMDLKAAALAEPLAVGLHGVAIGGWATGKAILVSGSGPIGLLAAAGAKAGKAAEIWATDILDGPLERARALGVDKVVRVGHDELPADHFDVVLECTGVAAAFNGCIPAVRKAGVISQIGMFPGGPQPINMAGLLSKEVEIRGAFRFDNEIDFAIQILASDEGSSIADVVITHVYPLTDAVEAFEMAKNSQESGKVLIDLT